MLRNRRYAVLFAFLLFSAAAIFAQAGTSLEAEIQSIEGAVAKQGISAVERHDALVRLARLRQLSGDIEGAAKNWLEAAAAIPGSVDDEALLSCAYCLAAMGEWDRARAAIAPLLSKSQRARFLDISIQAINTGNTSTLVSIANNSEYSQLKSEIYFMLWKMSRGENAENWRRRLAAEFPQTPEGRLALGGTSAVVMRQSPLWLFLGGLDSLPLVETPRPSSQATAPVTPTPPQPQAAAAPQATTPQPPVSPPPVAQTTPQPQVTPPTPTQTVRLQTGVFSRRANADTQMANLRKAGFTPSLEQRGEMWAVTVPSGTDQARTIRDLKTAGFDSFPIK